MKQGKAWGTTRLLFSTPFMEVHRISVKEHGFCSVHRHEHKWNGFYVEWGQLVVKVWQPSGLLDETLLGPGDHMQVPPGVDHQFLALGEPVTAFEVYWVGPLAEDIVRRSQGGIASGSS